MGSDGQLALASGPSGNGDLRWRLAVRQWDAKWPAAVDVPRNAAVKHRLQSPSPFLTSRGLCRRLGGTSCQKGRLSWTRVHHKCRFGFSEPIANVFGVTMDFLIKSIFTRDFFLFLWDNGRSDRNGTSQMHKNQAKNGCRNVGG